MLETMKNKFLQILLCCFLAFTGRSLKAQTYLTDSSSHIILSFLKEYESSFNQSIISNNQNELTKTYFHSKNALIYNVLANKSFIDSLNIHSNNLSYLQIDDIQSLYKSIFKQDFSYQLDYNHIQIKNNDAVLISKEQNTETFFYNIIIPVQVRGKLTEKLFSVIDTLNFDISCSQNSKNKIIKVEINNVTKADDSIPLPFQLLRHQSIDTKVIKQKLDSLMSNVNILIQQKEDSTTQKKYLTEINSIIEPSGYFHILSSNDSLGVKIDARKLINNSKSLAQCTFIKAKVNFNRKDLGSKGVSINTLHNVAFKEGRMSFDKQTGVVLYDKAVQEIKPGWWIYEVWIKIIE